MLELENSGIEASTILDGPEVYKQLTEVEQRCIQRFYSAMACASLFERILANYRVWRYVPTAQLLQSIAPLVTKAKTHWINALDALPEARAKVVESLDKVSLDLEQMFPIVSLNNLKGFTKHAGLYATPMVMTSNCPDHDSVRLMRVAGSESVYCCPLDGKKYDFLNGFTKSNGEHMNGTSIADQIPDFLGQMY